MPRMTSGIKTSFCRQVNRLKSGDTDVMAQQCTCASLNEQLGRVLCCAVLLIILQASTGPGFDAAVLSRPAEEPAA